MSVLLFSCNKSSDGNRNPECDGKSMVMFRLDDICGFSKSVMTVDEGRLNDVSVFAYADGYLADSKCFTSFSDMGLELFPDKVYDFYAVANMGEVTPPVLEEEIEAFAYEIGSVSELSGGFPMCWSQKGYVPSDGRPVSVSLSRLVSKIVLRVDNDVDGMAVSSARLVQSPLSVSPFAKGGSRASEDMVGSGDEASQHDLSELNSGRTSVFYTLENMQGTLLPDNDDPMQKVPDRLSGFSGMCTYLEVVCKFDEGYDKEGSVMYRMYLGEDNVTNFDVERNRILNVTLQLTSEGFGIRDSWKVVPDYIQHVTSLKIDEEDVKVRIGREAKLSVSVFPSDAYDKGVVWESDDASVAYVDADGNVKGVGEGSCVIRARSSDRSEISSECTVYVENRVEQMRFLSSEAYAVLGSDGSSKYSSFNVEAVYSDGSVRDVTNLCGYASSSSSACVDVPGVITHLSEGTSLISAEFDGVSASMTAVTEAFAIADIELNARHLTIPLGDTFTLKFRMLYNDGTFSSWISYGLASVGNASADGWYSEDYRIADVNTYGVVTPASIGRSNISITVIDTGKGVSFTKSLTVTVSEAYVVDVYVAASPMFCGTSYSLGLMGVFSDGTESALKADSWSVSTPYVTFSEGSAGLQIADETELVEGAEYEFTATYDGMSSSACMKYGRWVLEAGLEKMPAAEKDKFTYRMFLVMCDHSRIYVPFTCRYSSYQTGWQSVDTVSDAVSLWYYCSYVEAVSASSYYDWSGEFRQWEVRNH